jgi:hypothetical protein
MTICELCECTYDSDFIGIYEIDINGEILFVCEECYIEYMEEI